MRILARILISAVMVILFGATTFAQSNTISKADLTRLKQRLLAMINQERRAAGLRDVEIDEFATRVAERHCQEMLTAGFTSHWNQQGLKPYMRYSQAGGMDAVAENVAGKWSNSSIDAANVAEIVEQLHLAMYYERPPHDYHRRTILAPQHTHVGIAIAFNEGRVEFAEEFVARYLELGTVPRKVKSGDVVTLTGELLFDKTELHNIDILYEPAPRPLTVDTLNRSGDYSFPNDRLVLRPKLSEGFSYNDGTRGVIDYDQPSGKFSCPIDFKGARPGLYTIVVWINMEGNRFPATNICVEVK